MEFVDWGVGGVALVSFFGVEEGTGDESVGSTGSSGTKRFFLS